MLEELGYLLNQVISVPQLPEINFVSHTLCMLDIPSNS